MWIVLFKKVSISVLKVFKGQLVEVIRAEVIKAEVIKAEALIGLIVVQVQKVLEKTITL